MKYEKPKCDCGEELVVSRDKYITVQFKINKSGTEAQKPFYQTKLGFNEEGFIALVCPKCNTAYNFIVDHNRIYREEKLS